MGSPVDDALDRLVLDIARLATNGTIVCEWCNASDVTDDAHRSGCPVPEIEGRLATVRRQVEQLREERDGWEKIAESRALYAHKQAARMGAHASAPQPTPVSGVPLAATGKASEGAEDGTGIDTRYRGRAEAAEAEARQLREERDAWKQRHIDSERDWRKEWLAREAAEAELERLRRHPDAWSQEAFDQQKARAEAAEAEVQRYREGLREIAQYRYPLNETLDAIIAIKKIARDVLADSPPDGEPVYCVCGNILGSKNCCPEPDQGGEAGGWGVQSSGGGVPPDGGGAK